LIRTAATISASLLALACAQSAAAQDKPAPASRNATAPAADESGTSEIVVTATRRPTNVQDTPIAITAVTSQTLENRGIDNVSELSAVVPNGNFRMNQGAYGKGVSAFIRGIGQVDSNLASEPGVAYYVDDVYYPLIFGSQFDLLDLDHIEVLRGPQGTLFGRNALAGAVNIVSKQPDFSGPSATITATTGAYSRFDLRAGFNLPLTSNLAIRINGSSRHRQGYQDKLDFTCEMIRRGTPDLAGNFPYTEGNLIKAPNNNPTSCVIGHLGGESVNAMRAAALWEPASNLRITVTGDYTDDESENQADTLVNIDNTIGASKPSFNAIMDTWTKDPAHPFRFDQRFITGNPYQTYGTYGDPIQAGANIPGTFYNGNPVRGGLRYQTISPVINWGVSGKAVWDVAKNMAITLVGGYRFVDTTFGFDVDGSPVALEQTRNNTGQNDWSGELRFTGSIDLLDWVVGGFYYRGHGHVHTTLVSPWLGQQRYQNHQYEPESKAIYANVIVKPIQKLRITLGGRYSDDEKFVNYDNRLDSTPSGDILFQVTPQDKRFDWKAGLDYSFTDQIMAYFSASTGFRLPAFNSRPFQPSQVTQIPGDDIVAYELGAKTELFDKRLRLNGTVFYTDYKTRPTAIAGQEYQLDPSGKPIVVPGGGSITQPLTNGPPGSTTCRLLTAAEIAAGTVGYSCVSRNYYSNTPGTVKGFELEADAQPIDHLLFNAQVGYAHFDSPDINATVNKMVVGIPEWNASAGLQYMFDAPQLDGSITPRLDWIYQGKIVYEANNTRYNQPGYGVFNARITYTIRKYDADFALGATNLFNKFYWQNFFVLQAFGYPQANAQPAAPREWYLSVTKRF
jgi:iron complex outermembrane receptor protein